MARAGGTLRVGVNLLWLRPGEVGGSETYLVRQLRPLVAGRHPDIHLQLAVLPGFAPAHPDVARGDTWVAPFGSGSRLARVVAENTWMRRRLRDCHVVHHGGGVTPMGSSPVVLTVHDVQYLTYPGTFSRVKLAYLRSVVPRSVRRAQIVVVPSDYVRRRLVDAYGVDPTQVRVAAHGVPAPSSIHQAQVADLRQRRGLDRPYVLYPAITYPHKNHAVLLDMMVATDVDVVLTGRRWPTDPPLFERAVELGVADRFHHLGHVPRAELDALYQGAVGVVFPSRYEGFGAPVLEAMAAGCPVVASDVTALPEVVGEAGILVDPDDPDAWARAVETLMTDTARRDELVTAGRVRAAAFSDEAAADVVAQAYRDAAAMTG